MPVSLGQQEGGQICLALRIATCLSLPSKLLTNATSGWLRYENFHQFSTKRAPSHRGSTCNRRRRRWPQLAPSAVEISGKKWIPVRLTNSV